MDKKIKFRNVKEGEVFKYRGKYYFKTGRKRTLLLAKSKIFKPNIEVRQ
jgi:hypothetical protein